MTAQTPKARVMLTTVAAVMASTGGKCRRAVWMTSAVMQPVPNPHPSRNHTTISVFCGVPCAMASRSVCQIARLRPAAATAGPAKDVKVLVAE